MRSKTVQSRGRRFRGLAVVSLLALSTVAAACADDKQDTSSGTTGTTEAMAQNAGTPTGPGCAAVPEDGMGSFAGMAQDPAATAASNNPALSTLVSAVTAAGLGDTLNGAGPFTIFAPTNDAFNKIPKADLDAVLADKATLTKILTLHVIAGEKLSSDQLAEQGSATTVEGEDITFAKEGDTLMVNGQASVVCADVPVANGTVHIIDSVLMPGGSDESAAMEPSGSACASVPAEGAGSFTGMAQDPAATAASNNPALSTLVAAVTAAGLGDTLNGEGPFTIFAPTNDAFNKIPKADLDAVLADKDTLTKILTLHVIAGEKLSSKDLVEKGSATTVEGQDITFTAGDDGSVMVNGQASTVCADVPVANGTVHIIDSVLMPS